MLPPEYYEYYDKLQLYKNYADEVDVILRIFKDFRGDVPTRVLDMGCGTGNHAFNFAARGMRVVGMDIDPKIVEVAKKKQGRETDNLIFVDTLGDVFRAFDLVVALFNVVNYIEGRMTFLEFFEKARSYLHKDGLLIFDCWNGVAVIRDLPKKLLKQIADLEVEVEPEVNLMRQRVIVHNRVHGTDCDFEFSYVHRLWTPQDFTEALEYAGFKSIKIVEWMRPTITASPDSWRIMFVCH